MEAEYSGWHGAVYGGRSYIWRFEAGSYDGGTGDASGQLAAGSDAAEDMSFGPTGQPSGMPAGCSVTVLPAGIAERVRASMAAFFAGEAEGRG